MTNDKKVTILCIDDSEDICFSLKTLFQTQGWVTVTAPGRTSAVEEPLASAHSVPGPASSW